MKLPPEVRDQIYKMVLLYKNKDEGNGNTTSNCSCKMTSHKGKPRLYTTDMATCSNANCRPENSSGHMGHSENYGCKLQSDDVAIMAINRLIRNESLPVFYGGHQFILACTTLLLSQVGSNVAFQAYVTSVRVVWRGINADEAFTALSKCVNLKCINLLIWNQALEHKTERETTRRAFFPHAIEDHYL